MNTAKAICALKFREKIPYISSLFDMVGIRVLWCSPPTTMAERQIGNFQNLITWDLKRAEALPFFQSANTLFVENALLAQRSGVYISTKGRWKDGHLIGSTAHYVPSSKQIEELDQFCHTYFGRGLLHGCNPKGPILVALQTRHDIPVTQTYPNSTDTILDFLKDVYPLLPKKKEVIIRPHPKTAFWFLKDKQKNGYSKYIRDHWEIDTSSDVYSLLSQVSMVVSNNSTLINEALVLGVPCFCLGQGAYTDNGVLNSSIRDRKLTKTRCKKIIRFGCSILRDQLLKDNYEKAMENPVLLKWMRGGK